MLYLSSISQVRIQMSLTCLNLGLLVFSLLASIIKGKIRRDLGKEIGIRMDMHGLSTSPLLHPRQADGPEYYYHFAFTQHFCFSFQFILFQGVLGFCFCFCFFWWWAGRVYCSSQHVRSQVPYQGSNRALTLWSTGEVPHLCFSICDFLQLSK